MRSRVGISFLAVVLFATLTGLSHAQTPILASQNFYCTVDPTAYQSSDPVGTCVAHTLPYVMIGLLISFLIVAVSYLIGEVLNIQGFKNWYRSEFYEALKSVVIVAIILSSLIILGGIAAGLTNTNASSGSTVPIDKLYNNDLSYLASSFTSTNNTFNYLLGVSLGTEYFKSLSLSTYFTIPFPPVPVEAVPVFGSMNLGTDFKPFQSTVIDTGVATPPTSILKDTFNFLVFPMMLIMGVQNYLFVDIIVLGLGLFLPIGLVFRAIPFLRPIGGTLIALAITAAIIYPALIGLINIPVSQYLAPFFAAQQSSVSPSCSNLIVCGALGAFNPASLIFSSGTTAFASMQNGEWAAENMFLQGNIYQMLNPLLANVGATSTQLVLFVIDLIAGVVAATNLAKVLGGSLRLGIGKMKLT